MKIFLSKILMFGVVALCLLAFGTDVARACSCSRLQADNVERSFGESSNVAVFRVKGLNKYKEGEKRSGLSNYNGENKSAVLTVEKVYKGVLKSGEETIFSNEGFCSFTFDEADIGRGYLFYLDKPYNGEWSAGYCSGSGTLRGKGDDILYLEKRDKVLGKTRLAGTVVQQVETDGEKRDYYYKILAGVPLRVRGRNKDITLKTDENGAYEIYDLAPGKYEITVPVIDGYSSRYFDKEKPISLEIREKQHTDESIFYNIDNSISGTIVDSSGLPMEGVCSLSLEPITHKLSGSSPSACTDKNGKFEFSGMLSGTYVVVVNKENKINSHGPFTALYYPNSATVGGATQFNVAPGTSISDLKITAPELSGFVTISGTVRFADGKPMVNESVWFYTGIKNAKQRKDFLDTDSVARTDENGRFRIRVLKGQKGILSTSFRAHKQTHKHCPQVTKLIEYLDWDFLDTIPFEIDTDQPLGEVELKFPFPFCDVKTEVKKK